MWHFVKKDSSGDFYLGAPTLACHNCDKTDADPNEEPFEYNKGKGPARPDDEPTESQASTSDLTQADKETADAFIAMATTTTTQTNTTTTSVPTNNYTASSNPPMAEELREQVDASLKRNLRAHIPSAGGNPQGHGR